MTLTDKQERFCQEYLKDLNGTQAAIRVGYSAKTATEQSSRLLTNVNVAARVKELMGKRSERTEITADVVLKELLLLAKVDLAQAYDEKGNLKPIHEIPEDVRRAIAGIKVYEEFEGYGKDRVKVGEVREVKFWDKTRTLELLGKHLKLFTDKVEHSGNMGLELLSDEQLDRRLKELRESEKGGKE